MPDRYQSLFGASRPALDPASLGPEWIEQGIFLVNKKTGERRLKQIPGAEPGLGKVEVPDPLFLATPGNMLPVINPRGAWNLAKEALGLAGATAADVNVGTARLPGQVLKATADTLKKGAESLDRRSRQKKAERADAYMKLFGTPGAAEAAQASREARELQLDPLRSAAELTARWTEEGRERLAEATQDLPTPLAVGVHQAAVTAGMLADPTLGAGAGKAPRALSEAAQEALLTGERYLDLFGRPMARTLERKAFVRPAVDPLALERPVFERPVFERPVFERPTIDPLALERPVYEPGQLGTGIEPLALKRPVFERPTVEPLALDRPVFDRGLPAEATALAPDLAAGSPDLLPSRLAGLAVGVHQAVIAAGRAPGALSEAAQARLARSGALSGRQGVEALLPFELHGGYPAKDVGRLPVAYGTTGGPPVRPRLPERTGIPVEIVGSTDPELRATALARWDFVSRRHPRIAAEVRGIEIVDKLPEGNRANWNPQTKTIQITPAAVDEPLVWMHELAHVPQKQGLKWSEKLDRAAKRRLVRELEAGPTKQGRAYANAERLTGASLVDPMQLSDEVLEQQLAVANTLHSEATLARLSNPRRARTIDELRLEREYSVLAAESRRRAEERARSGGIRLSQALDEQEAARVGGNRDLIELANETGGLGPYEPFTAHPSWEAPTKRELPLPRRTEVDSLRSYLPSEREALAARAKGLARLRPEDIERTLPTEPAMRRLGSGVPDNQIFEALGMRTTPGEGAELARLSLPIGEDLPLPRAAVDRGLQAPPAAKFAPPGPEARGAAASPPLGGQVTDPPYSLGRGDSGAGTSPPLGPRPGSGEAGFIKLRPTPLSPADEAAKEAAWQMRKGYAATERLGRYRAGVRAEELQKLIPKETDEAMTWMFHELGDPRSYAARPAEVQAKIAKRTGARRRVIERVLADPEAETVLQEVASWREQTRRMWDDLSDMWDLGFVKNYVHMTYEPPKGVKTVNPMSFGSVGTNPGLVRERSFLNPAEAMAAGWTPRTLRFSQLRAETEKVFAHAQAIRGLVDDLATLPLLQDGRPALTYATMGRQPKGYIRVSGVPVLEKAAQRSPSSARALPEAVRHAELLQAESRRAAETAGGFYRYTPEGGTAPSVIEQPMLPGADVGALEVRNRPLVRRGELAPAASPEGLGPRTFRPPRTPTTPSDLWVHPKIWEELKPVLDVAEPLKVDRFLGTVKRIKFLGSIFHPFELGLAAMQSMGPVRGARAWASRGGGIPGLAQLAERRGWATPFTQEVAEKWVRRGLGVEAPSADMMTDAFQRAMVDWEDAMTRAAGKAGAVARAAGAAGKGLRVTANYYDEAIWKILHSPLKIAAAEQWEAQLMAARAGDRGAMGVANRFLTPGTRARLAAMSDEEIGEAVASAINNHFGGQVWELSRNRLFSDPRALKWMRRVFLSPDWNVSAISSGLSPLSSDPVHRVIGRTYWTNITALAAGFSVLNYALTAGSEQGPHFPWENEEGHKMDLETPFRTDKGRKIFYRIGKHAQELPHFAIGTPGVQQLRFLAGKTAPIVHAAAGLLGESVTEFPSPYEKLVQERERTGEVPGPVETIAARLQPAAEMMLPFSVQDAEDPGDILRKLLISIPESKGMSTYKAENLYAQALYDDDPARLAEIVEILRQNGYDDEAIGFMIQGAKRKAKRRLRAGR